jgi:hypothetical protein
MPTIQQAVNQTKQMVEEAITISQSAKTSLIRSQKLIRPIHEAVKSELISNGIGAGLIFPPIGANNETELFGYLKKKTQDIIVIPQNLQKNLELIDNGLHRGRNDEFGSSATERILSINARSQMSSLSKNIDTLYERNFAESLNLHLRCPRMCLGEVYLIPTREYNLKKTRVNIESYLNAFNAISERVDTQTDHYKYEKICLLIVDFHQAIPIIYSSDKQLKAAGLIPQNSTASITNLTFDRFIPSLLETYRARFPNLI